MDERETSHEIERVAAEWVASMDRAPLSASDAEELKAWLAGDRRRRGAFLRARAVWMRSESARALGPHYDPKEVRPRGRFMKWAGALAASFVLIVMLIAALQMPTAYATAKGEMRTVPLGDGTTVTLNTDTRIKVYGDKKQRRIRVLRGEVFIEGSSAVTPTVVEVDGKHLEASAATFVVRKLEGQPAQVLVQTGRVAPNSDLAVKSLSFGQMGRELAWREGKIALQGETLAEAAATYARYSDTPIVIADPALARMQITGLFAVNNPLGFSRAVAEVFNAEVREEGDRIVIARKY